MGKIHRRNQLALLVALTLSSVFVITHEATASQYEFTTFAGRAGGWGSEDGPRDSARFKEPAGIARDSAGNLYVADTGNHTIRKIATDGTVSTLAGTAGVSGSSDGVGAAARFLSPGAIAVAGGNTIYVADTGNSTIRKITADGTVTTLAGSPGLSGTANGTGGTARFAAPGGLAVSSSGEIFIADTGNHAIRKATAAGVVTAFAGSAGTAGFVNNTGTSARFYSPAGIAFDSTGNLYVSDRDNYRIRKVTSTAVVTTLAGGNFSGNTDGTGTAARFTRPVGIAVEPAGNLIVTDEHAYLIRKVTTAGVVTTLAGTAGSLGFQDDTGSAARFRYPTGVVVDAGGTAFVVDTRNQAIRAVSSSAAVTTYAGRYDYGNTDGSAAEARFWNPKGTAVDGAGNVYVADSTNRTIRKISPSGLVSTIAGLAGSSGYVDATGSAARFIDPRGIAIDGSGNVFVADSNKIRKITPTGEVTTFGGVLSGVYNPVDLAFDSSGNLFATDVGQGGNSIFKFTPDGLRTTFLSGSALVLPIPFTPSGLTIDVSDNLYVVETANHVILKVSPSGHVTTLAGMAGVSGITDGSNSTARFKFYNGSGGTMFTGIAVDAEGNAFVSDSQNQTIRRISQAGEVTTVGGIAGQAGIADGIGLAARFHNPSGLALDGLGNLIVATSGSHTIRRGSPILEVPVITSLTSASGQAGIQFTYQINASDSPTAYSAAGLPSGLVCDSTTGLITGIPIDSGTFAVTLSAQNGAGTGTAELQLIIAPIANNYTVTFVTGENGVRSGGGALTQSIQHGNPAIAPTIVPNAGWQFTGWSSTFDNITSDLEITAIYLEAAQFTVTFSLGPNGYGTRIGGGELVQGIVQGGSAVAPQISPAFGQRFVGWDKPLSNITGNILITAVYEAYAVWTVTFDLGTKGTHSGGGALLQVVEQGYSAVAPAVTSEANWEFTGWDLPFNSIISNLTITALYAPANCVVTFDPGTKGTRSGGGALSQNIAYLGAAEAPLITPSAGWTFVGWELPFDSITGDVLIRAIYEAKTYTDTFDPGHDTSLWAPFEGEVAANSYGQAAGAGSSGNSLWFNGDGSRSATTVPLDITGSGVIRFKIALGNGNSPQWENVDVGEGEGIVVEYSVDGLAFATLSGPYINKVWQESTILLPQAAKTAHTRFRFRQLANSGPGSDNWAIDDLFIAHSQPTGGNTAPTAVASATVVNAAIGAVDLSGLLSADSDGTISSYAWTWSGGSATGISPGVTLPGGTTVITLTVTDNLGATGTATVTVHVNDTGSILSQGGLSGPAAALDAVPFNDGVPNLLKYAFNMNVGGPDVSVLTVNGTSGLPQIAVDSSGAEPVLKVAFLRRKGSGLIYTPQRSDTLGAFVAMTGTQTVTSIDSQWERVSVEEPAPPASSPSAFARVQVSLP